MDHIFLKTNVTFLWSYLKKSLFSHIIRVSKQFLPVGIKDESLSNKHIWSKMTQFSTVYNIFFFIWPNTIHAQEGNRLRTERIQPPGSQRTVRDFVTFGLFHSWRFSNSFATKNWPSPSTHRLSWKVSCHYEPNHFHICPY